MRGFLVLISLFQIGERQLDIEWSKATRASGCNLQTPLHEYCVDLLPLQFSDLLTAFHWTNQHEISERYRYHGPGQWPGATHVQQWLQGWQGSQGCHGPT